MDVKRRGFLFGAITGAVAAPAVAKAVEVVPEMAPLVELPTSKMAHTCSFSMTSAAVLPSDVNNMLRFYARTSK